MWLESEAIGSAVHDSAFTHRGSSGKDVARLKRNGSQLGEGEPASGQLMKRERTRRRRDDRRRMEKDEEIDGRRDSTEGR